MRISGLDSIRGVAALMVVFNHFYNMVPELRGDTHWLFNYTPLHWLTAGRCAVILFFVLSGYVLALPYESGRAQPYGRYIVKRFCRIWVPFVVVTLVAAGLCATLGWPRPEWAHGDDWSLPVDAYGVMAHVLMLGVGNESTMLNPPMWSLIHEMRISVIFPFLVLMVHRFGVRALVASAVLGVVCAKVFVMLDGAQDFYKASSGFGAVFLTMYYVPFFVLGALASHHRQALNGFIAKQPKALHVAVIGVFLFTPYAFLKAHFTFTDVFYACLAVYVIAGAQVSARLRAGLLLRVPMWLGRVSYSLYLTHIPVLMACVFALHDVLPLPAVLAVAFGVILLVAELTNRWLEKPAQTLGKRLGECVSRH